MSSTQVSTNSATPVQSVPAEIDNVTNLPALTMPPSGDRCDEPPAKKMKKTIIVDDIRDVGGIICAENIKNDEEDWREETPKYKDRYGRPLRFDEHDALVDVHGDEVSNDGDVISNYDGDVISNPDEWEEEED